MTNKSKLGLISLFFCAVMIFTMVGCTNKNGDKDSGEFAWLNSAYENNWFKGDELKSIAFYYNGLHYDGEVDYGEDFTPIAKNPVSLDESTQKQIISSYCKGFGVEELRDEVSISAYYGTYGNCIVIEIASGCTTGGGDPIYYPEYKLDGITFYNYSFIGVYRQKN